MAKKQTVSVIALEIEKYEKKIAEFQDYLEKHKNFELAEDKYKEGDFQTRLMDKLPNWILALKAMKEDAETKTIELRGGGAISDGARLIMERNKNNESTK